MRRQLAIQTQNTTFTMTMPLVIIPSRASEFFAKEFAGFAKSSSRQAVRLRRQANSRKRGISGLRNTQYG
jgi:hypothetical protein